MSLDFACALGLAALVLVAVLVARRAMTRAETARAARESPAASRAARANAEAERSAREAADARLQAAEAPLHEVARTEDARARLNRVADLVDRKGGR